jgi:hippurate hydrolase
LASIERITKGIAQAAGIPAERAPIVKVSETEVTPATYNDPKLTQRLAVVFEQILGKENVVEWPQIMGSEDFGRFSLEGHQIPLCLFWLGAIDPEKVRQNKQEGKPLPSLHSSLFEPLPEPTIRTGVKAMTAAILEVMKVGP